MPRPARIRLDQLLVERGLAPSRNVARGLVLAGLVQVEGRMVDKAGQSVPVDATLSLKERPRFVSRAGEKLAHALEVFGVDVGGARALDVGSSTGGFVDCLLQGGAAQVIAVDVGYGQLDPRLRNDARVTVLERTNARYLTADLLPYGPDLLTMDVSFISVTKVLAAVVPLLAPAFQALVLVKPQFEAGPRRVGKGGIVRDPQVHRDVLRAVIAFVSDQMQLNVWGVTDSGLPGAGGNREFVLWFGQGGAEASSPDTLDREVKRLVEGCTVPPRQTDSSKDGTTDE